MSGCGWEQVVQAVVIRFVLVVPNDKPRVTPLSSALYKHEGRGIRSSTQRVYSSNKQAKKKSLGLVEMLKILAQKGWK